MKKFATYTLLIAFLLAAASTFSFFAWKNFAQASSVPQIIINEIQVAGATSNDEFIELFNPADTPVNLEGYRLTKKTKTGSSESTLVSAAKFSGIIEARGYFLIAHPDYKDKISADLSYSSSSYYISNDNTVFLYNKDGVLLDKVGFGASSDFETAPAPNPESNQSIERTNFMDTDNNAADFSINISPSPKNKSFTEIEASNSEEAPSNSNFTENIGDPENNEEVEIVSENTLDDCSVLSSSVKLNEIFPYPENEEEFVEVLNTGENCVDVSGWKIMDEAGHKKEFPANSILDPGDYLILKGNLYLNNDSDTVYLLGKNEVDKTNALDYKPYEKAKKNFSYSFDEESWQ